MAATPQKALKYRRRQAEIADAAIRQLNEHGVQGLNLSELATALGMTKANLTYYFRRKDELAAHCYDLALDAYRSMIDNAAQAEGSAARLDAFLANYLHHAAAAESGEKPQLAILGDVRALEEPLLTRVIEHYSEILFAAGALLDRNDVTEPQIFRTIPRAELALVYLFWSAVWLGHYPRFMLSRTVSRLQDIAGRGILRQPDSLPDGVDALRMAQRTGEGLERAEFFRAAIRMINVRGYRGASLDRIAEAMDATKGTLYYQYDTKDDLVVACFRHSFRGMWDIITAVEAATEDASERLFTLVASFVAFQASDQGPFLRETALMSLPMPLRVDMVQEWTRIHTYLVSLISDGIAEGSVRPVDPLIAAHTILAGINAADEINRFVPGGISFDPVETCAYPILYGLLYDDPEA